MQAVQEALQKATERLQELQSRKDEKTQAPPSRSCQSTLELMGFDAPKSDSLQPESASTLLVAMASPPGESTLAKRKGCKAGAKHTHTQYRPRIVCEQTWTPTLKPVVNLCLGSRRPFKKREKSGPVQRRIVSDQSGWITWTYRGHGSILGGLEYPYCTYYIS